MISNETLAASRIIPITVFAAHRPFVSSTATQRAHQRMTFAGKERVLKNTLHITEIPQLLRDLIVRL